MSASIACRFTVDSISTMSKASNLIFIFFIFMYTTYNMFSRP